MAPFSVFPLETMRFQMFPFSNHNPVLDPPGGGVTTILPYIQVRDVPFFGVPFFEQKINFGVSFFLNHK